MTCPPWELGPGPGDPGGRSRFHPHAVSVGGARGVGMVSSRGHALGLASTVRVCGRGLLSGERWAQSGARQWWRPAPSGPETLDPSSTCTPMRHFSSTLSCDLGRVTEFSGPLVPIPSALEVCAEALCFGPHESPGRWPWTEMQAEQRKATRSPIVSSLLGGRYKSSGVGSVLTFTHALGLSRAK